MLVAKESRHSRVSALPFHVKTTTAILPSGKSGSEFIVRAHDASYLGGLCWIGVACRLATSRRRGPARENASGLPPGSIGRLTEAWRAEHDGIAGAAGLHALRVPFCDGVHAPVRSGLWSVRAIRSTRPELGATHASALAYV